MRVDLCISVLAISCWLVDLLHISVNLGQKEIRCKDVILIVTRVLDVLLINWVLIMQAIGSFWSPSFSDQCLTEDFLCVGGDQSAISVVSYSTSVVGLSYQLLNCYPGDFILAIIVVRRDTLDLATHVVRKSVFANFVIRVVERIRYTPTERFEFLTFY